MDLPAVGDEILNLNVGGCIYTTSRSTLMRYPDSMLGSMFSGRLPTIVDDRNCYVIDGDGPTFRHILNFLRRSKLILPDGFQEWDILSAEADYYQIQELIQIINETRKRIREDALPLPPLAKPDSFEFLELEYCKPKDSWRISGKINAIRKLPMMGKYDNEYEFEWLEYQDPEPYDESKYYIFTPQYVERLQLFVEISQQGFTLISSSPGIDDFTYRWTFSRRDKA
ncbi:BTB/POZ domain-containing protein KCTD6-like [Anneissia japonica]|uniref:BTB/POZ domain-containing protein KCTD6-like n=1 Tax=Anneissia japonica TaxID=1529436 RepID=UPI001425528B|nr:BTB/POZ domain-containing protein KCTD6-like [Anneissia japonica]